MRGPAPALASTLSSLLLLAAIWSVALLLAAGPTTANLNLFCPSCEAASCDVDPAVCAHGTVEDHCRRRVCAKGPGELCSGERGLHGMCGAGMRCKCNRCSGCSIDAVGMPCYRDISCVL